VSDIEYLATIESGNGPGNSTLRTDNSGSPRTTTGTLATLTAATGKDLYLAKAVVTVTLDSGNSPTATIELRQNGTPIEAYEYITSINFGAGRAMQPGASQYIFQIIGKKVDAAETWTLEVTAESNAEIKGSIECVEIDDGVSPRLE